MIPILLQEIDSDSGENDSGPLSRKMIPILLQGNDSDSGNIDSGHLPRRIDSDYTPRK